MKTFKAEKGDVFTSFNPDNSSFIAWCYRGDKSVDIRDYVDGREDFVKDKRDSTEKDMSPQKLERWGRENDIRIEGPEKPLAERLAEANIPPHLMARLKKWAESLPDGEPATVKESLPVQPLTFRDEVAKALFVDFVAEDSTPSQVERSARAAFDHAAILEAERARRSGV